jgi:putative acetyltransferase
MIRPATNNDCDAVRTLVFEVLAEHGLKPSPADTDADLGDLERHYLRRGGAFDVLLDDAGAIIGSVGVYPLAPDTCELRKMYLDSRHRGRGLGRLLLDHALRRAAELGFTRVELETSTKLETARKLYERYGFKPFRKEHVAERCDLTMFLELAPTSRI